MLVLIYLMYRIKPGIRTSQDQMNNKLMPEV